jgi:hypothetical protein
VSCPEDAEGTDAVRSWTLGGTLTCIVATLGLGWVRQTGDHASVVGEGRADAS